MRNFKEFVLLGLVLLDLLDFVKPNRATIRARKSPGPVSRSGAPLLHHACRAPTRLRGESGPSGAITQEKNRILRAEEVVLGRHLDGTWMVLGW